MAHICATGTTGRLKSWHIYVPLAVDGLKTKYAYICFLLVKLNINIYTKYTYTITIHVNTFYNLMNKNEVINTYKTRYYYGGP